MKYIREGFEQELAKCKTCEVVKTVDFTIPDFGPKLQQKAQGALLQHPEANAIHVPYDTPMLLGIGSAVLESGRNDQLSVIAGEGFPSNVQLIRDNRGARCGQRVPRSLDGLRRGRLAQQRLQRSEAAGRRDRLAAHRSRPQPSGRRKGLRVRRRTFAPRTRRRGEFCSDRTRGSESSSDHDRRPPRPGHRQDVSRHARARRGRASTSGAARSTRSSAPTGRASRR